LIANLPDSKIKTRSPRERVLLMAISQAPWPFETEMNTELEVRAILGKSSNKLIEMSIRDPSYMFGIGWCIAARTRSGITDGPGIETIGRPWLRDMKTPILNG